MSSSSNTALTVYSGMPTWAKGIAVISCLAAVFGVGYTIYKRSKREEALDKSNQLLQATGATIEAYANVGVRPTHTTTQYKTLADELESCFQGWGTCTSYMNVFENMNNAADLIRLIQEYGIRKISSGKFNIAPDFEGGLTATLIEELSTNELNKLAARMKAKGIDFKLV